MEQFFASIIDYLKSPEFTAICASALAIWTAVSPIINKISKNKLAIKMEQIKNQYAAKSAEFAQLQTQLLEYSKICDSAAATIKTIMANSANQNEAMKKAFNASNLKQDVKDSIAQLLMIDQTVENIATPINNNDETAVVEQNHTPTPTVTAEKTDNTIEYERIV